MKLCVIGNSHVGALRSATLAHPPDDLSLSFFAKPGLDLDEVDLDGTRLIARSAGLQEYLKRLDTPEELDLATFDGVVLVAMSATLFTASQLLVEHRLFGHPADDTSKTGYPALTRPRQWPLISGPALQAALSGISRRLPAYLITQALRESTQIPVCLVPQPFASERILQQRGRFQGFKRIHLDGEGPTLARLLERSYRDTFNPLGQVACVQQPAETRTDDWLTNDAFSRGGARVDGIGKHPESDILHTNAAYGQLVLKDVVAAMNALKANNS